MTILSVGGLGSRMTNSKTSESGNCVSGVPRRENSNAAQLISHRIPVNIILKQSMLCLKVFHWAAVDNIVFPHQKVATESNFHCLRMLTLCH